ncbi:MAG: hypothetical protein LZF86_110950 [Nitrospira sp.]|nr:MAG: hypothetical protein LZF86_110950 [Nitrospira sp.]
MARFVGSSHFELARLVEAQHVEVHKVSAVSGKTYQVEIQFFWDDQSGDTIRVVGSVDDGGMRAFLPLTDSVLISRRQML